jgi:hypothetical protein
MSKVSIQINDSEISWGSKNVNLSVVLDESIAHKLGVLKLHLNHICRNIGIWRER